MVHETTDSKSAASTEGRAEDGAGDSVLDFLWQGEAPEATAAAAQDEAAQGDSGQAVEPDSTPAEGLKGALAHYSNWLSAWTSPT